MRRTREFRSGMRDMDIELLITILAAGAVIAATIAILADRIMGPDDDI